MSLLLKKHATSLLSGENVMFVQDVLAFKDTYSTDDSGPLIFGTSSFLTLVSMQDCPQIKRHPQHYGYLHVISSKDVSFK